MLVLTTALISCATDPGVATTRAQRIDVPPSTTDTEPPLATQPPIVAPPTTSTAPTQPTQPSLPSTGGPATTSTPQATGDVLDFGDVKPARDYDAFIAATVADLQAWWAELYPRLYGASFTPLAGKVYAAYPERTSPIPGCDGGDPMPYEEAKQYGALYCADGDFMVYDDGDGGILDQLASEYGQATFGVVLSHEYGHAIQARDGDLARQLPTVTTEQQADCFSGAWMARAARGEVAGITLTDSDVRTGLVAMITVRDPIGTQPNEAGTHGSAFDRVGAFQVGFTAGPERCAELIDDPLPLVPNVFRRTASSPDGNSPYGYGDGEVVSFTATDLNDFWTTSLAAIGVPMGPMTVVPVQSADELPCSDPTGSFTMGAVACPSRGEVYLDEPLALDLYGRFGDFAVGYMLGAAWSDAAQVALGSPLHGETRYLVDDCMTGAWAASIIPDASGQTARGSMYIEPRDLDEAIQTALVVGDAGSGDDVIGSGFEKIASFRGGVLDGLDSCTAQIGD